jgi:hypothetical protein
MVQREELPLRSPLIVDSVRSAFGKEKPAGALSGARPDGGVSM